MEQGLAQEAAPWKRANSAHGAGSAGAGSAHGAGSARGAQHRRPEESLCALRDAQGRDASPCHARLECSLPLKSTCLRRHRAVQRWYATEGSNPRPAEPRQACYSHV